MSKVVTNAPDYALLRTGGLVMPPATAAFPPTMLASCPWTVAELGVRQKRGNHGNPEEYRYGYLLFVSHDSDANGFRGLYTKRIHQEV